MPLIAVPEYDNEGNVIFVLQEDESSKTKKEREIENLKKNKMFHRNMCPENYETE